MKRFIMSFCWCSHSQALGNDDLVSKVKQSRGEKKARKIMSKLGLKQVSCRKVILRILKDENDE